MLDAIRRTASSSSAVDVPKLSRAQPRPCSPKDGPSLSATRPRSRNTVGRVVAEPELRGSRARRDSRHRAARSRQPGDARRAARRAPSGSGRDGRTSASSHSSPCSNAAIDASTPKMARVNTEMSRQPSLASRRVHPVGAGHDHRATSGRRCSSSSRPTRARPRSRPRRRRATGTARASRPASSAAPRPRRRSTVTPCSAASSPTAASCSAAKAVPVGLCGFDRAGTPARPPAKARCEPVEVEAPLVARDQRHLDDLAADQRA